MSHTQASSVGKLQKKTSPPLVRTWTSTALAR